MHDCVCVCAHMSAHVALSPWHWLSWTKKPCGQLGTQRPSCRLDVEGQDVQFSADGPVHSQQEGWHSEKKKGSGERFTHTL